MDDNKLANLDGLDGEAPTPADAGVDETGKHGQVESGTEVPTSKLVKELRTKTK